jgi:hypothetical protein
MALLDLLSLGRIRGLRAYTLSEQRQGRIDGMVSAAASGAIIAAWARLSFTGWRRDLILGEHRPLRPDLGPIADNELE